MVGTVAKCLVGVVVNLKKQRIDTDCDRGPREMLDKAAFATGPAIGPSLSDSTVTPFTGIARRTVAESVTAGEEVTET